mgnify:CR=1 FL=1
MPLYFLLAAALVAVDQVVKYLVRAGIPLHTAVDFLPGLDLTYVQNTGAAFSLFTPGCSPSCPGWCPWFW